MSTAVATIQPRSVLVDMSTRYGMEPKSFEATLRATVVPKDASAPQFAAFLLVAKEYGLNPLTKEIYAFPTRNGGIQPIVSIDGWSNIINSHPAFDGIEFDDHLAGSEVTAISARIWRKDRSKPTVVTEYLAECRRNTDTWKQWPRRMLRHKAMIQCARYAFGFSGIVDPDEADRFADVSDMRDVSRRSEPPEPPQPKRVASPRTAPAEDVVTWEDASQEEVKSETTSLSADDIGEWLKGLDGAFSGAEDFATLAEEQQRLMAPMKGKVPGSAWTQAEKLASAHLERIQKATDEDEPAEAEIAF